jgi:hypothetical protein
MQAVPLRMKTPGRCFHAAARRPSPTPAAMKVRRVEPAMTEIGAAWSIANISAALQNNAHTRTGVLGVLNAT